jgi:hypothetical protein
LAGDEDAKIADPTYPDIIGGGGGRRARRHRWLAEGRDRLGDNRKFCECGDLDLATAA